jgi:predicted membrane channel-forming protein YqfA (hemolysin III family)
MVIFAVGCLAVGVELAHNRVSVLGVLIFIAIGWLVLPLGYMIASLLPALRE